MKKEIKLYNGRYVAHYTETEENKQAVWDMLIKWCERWNVYNGECFQSDDTVIEAPSLVAEMIDKIVQFDVKES